MNYRPDIDGLRALAVSSVVIFHADLFGLTGGFLGVDVFFVISGFLITNLIAREIDQGNFSLASFYERRVRRIIPAAATVFAASAALAWWMLLPAAFAAFCNSLLAAVLFSSNWYFLSDVGYFAGPATSKPLLHTWTLSIEEQFYLVFPFLMLLLATARRRFIVLAALCATSIAYAIWLRNNVSLDAAFYNSASRAFEPLIGCLTALGYRRFTAGPVTSGALRLAGLGLIGFALLTDGVINIHFSANAYALFGDRFLIVRAIIWNFLGDNMNWLAVLGDEIAGNGTPSYQRMITPCIGAALFLLARPAQFDPLFRIMASPPFRAIGVMSYSIYLWHWPALVFARIYWAGELDATQTAAVITATLVLSAITLRAVENPIRFGARLRGRRGVVFALASASTAALALFATSVVESRGVPSRLPAEARAIIPDRVWDSRLLDCFSPPGGPAESVARARNDTICRIGDMSRTTDDFILWGDSHALALAGAFSEWAREDGLRGIFASVPGCPSLSHTANSDLGRAQRCADFYDAVAGLIARHDIRQIVMIDRWSLYTEGEPAMKSAGYLKFSDDWNHRTNPRDVFTSSLDRTLSELGARHIALLMEPPLQRVDVTDTMAANALMGFPASRLEPVWTTRSQYLARQAFLFQAFAAARSKFSSISLLDPLPFLCDGDHCSAAKDGLPLYYDDEHLNNRGAMLLRPLFAPVLRQIKDGARSAAAPAEMTKQAGAALHDVAR